MTDYSLIEENDKDRILNEWLDLWTPIDELVRPHTPLGEGVRDKVVELIKKGLIYQVLSEVVGE